MSNTGVNKRRPTNLDRAHTRLADSETVTNYNEVMLKALKLIVVEGFTLGTAVMIFRVTDKVEKESSLGKRRKMLIGMLEGVDRALSFNVPVVDFAPMEWLSDFFEIYIDELKKEDEKEPTVYYARLDFQDRVELTIMVPALLRLTLQFIFNALGGILTGIGEIVPG